MKRLISAAAIVAAFAVASSAQAADIARPVYKAAPVIVPIYNWSGFYIGGHAGYGWAKADTTVLDNLSGAFPRNTVFSSKPDGFLGGLQAGVNWQTGAWVFGIEGEYSWTSIDDHNVFNSRTVAGFTNAQDRDLDYVATVAGRIGYAWNNSLLYFKGGWAWTSTSNFAVTRNAAGAVVTTSTADSDRDGWLIGAGWEYGFAPNWSFKVEYNYMDFGSKDGFAQFTVGASPRPRSTNLDMQVIKAGVNYRFDWGKSPVIAKY